MVWVIQFSWLLCVLACWRPINNARFLPQTDVLVETRPSYHVSRVTGDRYAGEFPRELFRKHGIAYDLAKQTKSELFRDLLPLLNSGRIVLPRNDRLLGQIVGLERRTSAVGRDTISHPDRGHDDVANAVAGAAALSKFGGYDTSLRWVSGDDDSDAAWQRVRLQAFINSGGRIRL
jgi:hypothetical protein